MANNSNLKPLPKTTKAKSKKVDPKTRVEKNKKPVIKPKNQLYWFSGFVFIIASLLANLMAVKQFSLPFGIIAPAGVLVFPITYIFGDVVSEVYGFFNARLLAIIGIGVNILFTCILWLAVLLPYPDYFNNDAFSFVFSQAPRIALAGFVAMFFGQIVNDFIMHRFHLKNNEKGFGFRAILSTLFGELTDSFIFINVAFAFVLPFKVLLSMIITQVVIKVLYEIILLPFTYRVVKFYKTHDSFKFLSVERDSKVSK